MKDKILQFILERKWLLSIIIVLMIVVGMLVFSVTTLSSQIQQGQQTETTGTSEFSFSYPTGVTEEETEKVAETEPTDSTSREDMQIDTEAAELEAELRKVIVQYLDAYYDYDESETTSADIENALKSVTTEEYYKKYINPEEGASVFVLSKGEVSSYYLDSIYYADLDTDSPKASALYNTRRNSDSSKDYSYLGMFQAFTFEKVDGEWKIAETKDYTTLGTKFS